MELRKKQAMGPTLSHGGRQHGETQAAADPEIAVLSAMAER